MAHPALFPLPPCSSVRQVAPQGSNTHTPGIGASEEDDYADSFISSLGFEFTLDPDELSKTLPQPEGPIQLERRGVTEGRGNKLWTLKAKPSQSEFWKSQTALKNSVAAKLRESGAEEYAVTLENCHSYFTYALCMDCHTVKRFPNRCDNFFCPECQEHLATNRRKQVEWWANMVQQPKHVVLTLRNLPSLNQDCVSELQASFRRLRNRKFAKGWRGGFYSIEVTNEGNGWHLHLHALIDADWIDSAALALQWDSVTKGWGRIVKVKDARDHSYLAEICKYAVKGNQLATWQPTIIRQFIEAFAGKRTFGVFGSLYGKRTEWSEFIASLKAAKAKCDCGGCNIKYLSELEWIELDLRPETAGRPPPEKEQTGQPSLL